MRSLEDQQTLSSFKLALRNKFQVLADLLDEEPDVQTHWQETKNTITTTCAEELERVNTHKKEWISVNTLNKIQARKQKKKALITSRTRARKAACQAEYTEAYKEVKQSVKKDKKEYFEQIAEKAEQAAGSGNMKELYDSTRKPAGK